MATGGQGNVKNNRHREQLRLPITCVT